MSKATLRKQHIARSDNVSITVAVSEGEVRFLYSPSGPVENANLYIALGTHRQIGSAIVPFAQHSEGSTVFLPFKCDLLLSAEVRSGRIACFVRRWENWRWSEREQTHDFEVTAREGAFACRIPRYFLHDNRKLDFLLYAKDPAANHGWCRMVGSRLNI